MYTIVLFNENYSLIVFALLLPDTQFVMNAPEMRKITALKKPQKQIQNFN